MAAFGQIRKDLTTPERPFEFLGKEKFFHIFAFFGVAKATRSSRQFLELRPKAERIEGGAKVAAPLPLRSEFSPNFFVNELRKGVRKTDGRLALAGKGQPELCKAQIVTWHQPPVKKNKKRGTQKFCPN